MPARPAAERPRRLSAHIPIAPARLGGASQRICLRPPLPGARLVGPEEQRMRPPQPRLGRRKESSRAATRDSGSDPGSDPDSDSDTYSEERAPGSETDSDGDADCDSDADLKSGDPDCCTHGVSGSDPDSYSDTDSDIGDADSDSFRQRIMQ